jgi:hypothetical protein
VEPDGHHPWAVVSLVPQVVERAATVVEEVRRAPERPVDEPHVIGGKGVGDDEVTLSAHLHVVGEVVVVSVGVVEEASLLDEQLARVLARHPSAVPADRAFATGSLDRHHGAPDPLCLFLA